MPDVSFSTWIAGLAADTLSGPEKIPLLDVDGTTSKHATATLLAAFAVDQLQAAAVSTITTLNDADMLNAFQSGVAKKLTAQNFFNWVVDKLEALPTETTIVNGDKLVFNDGGVLKQIDIATVKTFLNSTDVALGSQIDGLSTASTPLNITDQFVLARGSVASKTTLQWIRDKIYTDYLAYVAGLVSVGTLADADVFYVAQGGATAKKATALNIGTYIQNGVGSAITSAPWGASVTATPYAAIGGAALGTDVFLLQRSAVGKTATGANIATYVVSTQNSASALTPAAAGDGLLVFRSGTQYKMDVDVLSTYALASGWSAASVTPTTGDKLTVGRGGVTKSITIDQLQTFVLTGIQANVLNLTGLSDATLDGTDVFLVGEGATARKASLTQLETQLWIDYKTHVTGLTSVGTLVDADTFYTVQSGTAKKTASSTIWSYVEEKLWGASTVTPVLAGDNLYMRRGATSYRLDVGALATYVSTLVAGSINIAGLSSATLSSGDLFIVNDGGVNKNVTLANLQSEFWTAFATYVSALSPPVSAANTDVLYSINLGSPQKITVGSLWSTRYVYDAKSIKLDDFAACDDNTDLNATSSAHGLLPKLSNNTRQFMRGDGTWATYASVTATATAATGSVHTDAAALASTNITFITSDGAAKGVKLPTGAPGDIMDVINNSATAARLYPATTGTLNGLAVNAAVVIPASRGVRCFCSATNAWTVFEMYSKAAAA
jgi:hypothetical protein